MYMCVYIYICIYIYIYTCRTSLGRGMGMNVAARIMQLCFLPRSVFITELIY